MTWILDALAALGRGLLGACAQAGSVAIFAITGLSHLVRPPFYGRMFWRAFVEFAYFSLPVVALTAIFSGMVIALQSYTGFSRFNAESAVASIVVLSVVRELGPVLAGLMVAGRVGAAMAAELGTMRVTDQIDALTTLSTDPMKYLVAPACSPAPWPSRCWSSSPTSSASWAATSSPCSSSAWDRGPMSTARSTS